MGSQLLLNIVKIAIYHLEYMYDPKIKKHSKVFICVKEFPCNICAQSLRILDCKSRIKTDQ